MYKEHNCECVVCTVEQELLKTLNTQTARDHFKALAHNYSVPNHLSSPLEVVAQLHGQAGRMDHDPGNQILHTLIHAVSDQAFEDLSQQLLLVAFTPAIHKTCRDVCGQFPALTREDVAQQASAFLLEAARSPFMLRQNGHLPIALVRRLRRETFRWAIKENENSIAQEKAASWDGSQEEAVSDEDLEQVYALFEFLRHSRDAGLLSDADEELLIKYKCEGFEAKELAAHSARRASPAAIHLRLQRILNRLRRAAQNNEQRTGGCDA
jgi:DNA-directed RNA polymerase specialized sigma24 family protein